MAKSSREKNLSFEEFESKLEALKKECEECDKGYRKAQYRLLQNGAALALLAEADDDVNSRSRDKLLEKDLLRGVLIFIFGAKSEAKKKEASKRALALRYLVENLEVDVQDIATAIPKHGGIAKLARKAAEYRRKETDAEIDEDEEEDNPEEVGENNEPENNLGKQIPVGFSPELTRKLNDFVDKTRTYLKIGS